MCDTLSPLLEMLDEGVCIVAASGTVERWSRAAEGLTGRSAAHAMGRDLSIVAPGALEIFEREYGRGTVEIGIVGDDGETRPVVGTIRALVDQGAIVGWIFVLRSDQRLREIDQLKAEFVGTVSHELRTPLTSIKAYTATLRTNPRLDETTRTEFLQIVEHEADRLTRLVDDLLVVTRVESGYMLKRRETVALQQILDGVLANLARDMELHPIRLDVAGIVVSGDPDRLHEVFANLLENAVKYSPHGGEIRVWAAPSRDGVKVMVRDAGVGIPEGELELIFERFYRVDHHLTAAAGGSGLGLYIVRSIVRAHGGTVEVTSEVGQGTTFTVTLPERSA